MQKVLCKNKELCYFGESPTLAEIRRDYGELSIVALLNPHITEMTVFANKKGMPKETIEELALIIATEFYYLKVTEVMLFFYNLKIGMYGDFYGSISTMDIVSALRKMFLRERDEAYQARDNRLYQEKLARDAKNAITYEEYLRRKKEIKQ